MHDGADGDLNERCLVARENGLLRRVLRCFLLAVGLAAPLTAQAFDFYHGTDYESAQRIVNERLTPWTAEGLGGGSGDGSEAPWTRYTDFGKGFYTHVPGQYELAQSWAMRSARSKCAPGQSLARWGVVVFRVDPELLRPIDVGSPERVLYFRGKGDRPWNAPWSWREPGLRQTWLEFIEVNRHREDWGTPGIQRPGDYDWSQYYAWIQGPIWVPRDSGIDAGGEPIPEHVHQRNWLVEGLDRVLNQPGTQRWVVDGTIECPAAFVPSAAAYGVFLASEDVIVGIKEELEAIPSCRFAGWGVDCERTVGQVAQLRLIAGPFATREEAVGWFCANIVPDSFFRPPLASFLQGATFRFDGQKHMISNGPACP